MTNEEIQEIVAKADDEYDRLKDRVHEQYDEIERLKDLCNKYEEEHKTTFEEWKKAINIIKEVREELNKIDSATYQGDTDKKTYYKYEQTRIQKLLEILDKVNKEE